MEHIFVFIEKILNIRIEKKFSFLVTIFATLISGFVIIFSINPEYAKDLNPLTIILMSFSAIAPLYLLNQLIFFIYIICYLIRFDSTINEYFNNDNQVNINKKERFVKAISKTLTGPRRFFGEFFTIIISYISALITSLFGGGFFVFLIVIILLIMLEIYFLKDIFKIYKDKVLDNESRKKYFETIFSAFVDNIDKNSKKDVNE